MHSSSSFTSFGLDRTAVFRICSLDVYLKAGLAKYAWWCIDFASHDFKVLDLNIVTACSKKQWLLEVKLTIKN